MEIVLFAITTAQAVLWICAAIVALLFVKIMLIGD